MDTKGGCCLQVMALVSVAAVTILEMKKSKISKSNNVIILFS
jgi:hypothetical protein